MADRRVIANLDGPDPDCRSPVQPLQRVLARALFLRGGAHGDVAAGPSPVNATSPDLPAVVFERVSLAFDENVVLRDVSFSVPPGGMKVILGGSGAGKSVILKPRTV